MLNQPIPKLYLEKFHSNETEQKFHQEFAKSKKWHDHLKQRHMVHGSTRVHGFILLEKVSCNSKG